MKEGPFEYVLIVEHDHIRGGGLILLSVHSDLDETEDALRAHAASIWVDPSDDEIIETLTEEGQQVRIYACAWEHTKEATQTAFEVEPFADSMAA